MMKAISGRVLVVEENPKYFVSHRLPWICAAREAGCEIHVTALKAGDEDLVRKKGLKYHGIAERNRGNSLATELRLLFLFYRLLRELEPDLVHFITLRSILYGFGPARLAGVPAVLNSVTGLGFLFAEETWSTRLLRWGVTKALRLAVTHPNQITSFQNPDDTAEFIERGIVSESETVVTPGSGVDPERFPYVNGTSPDTENPIVMLPTRLLWHKGVVVRSRSAASGQRYRCPVRHRRRHRSRKPSLGSSAANAGVGRGGHHRLVGISGGRRYAGDPPARRYRVPAVVLPRGGPKSPHRGGLYRTSHRDDRRAGLPRNRQRRGEWIPRAGPGRRSARRSDRHAYSRPFAASNHGAARA